MKKIKIAQIGTSENSHGNSIWQRLTRLSDIFEIVGYAFPENEREKFPKQAAAFDGYREMSVEAEKYQTTFVHLHFPFENKQLDFEDSPAHENLPRNDPYVRSVHAHYPERKDSILP